jgi:hypothetical protein
LPQNTAVEFITEQEQVIKAEIAEIEERKKKLTASLDREQEPLRVKLNYLRALKVTLGMSPSPKPKGRQPVSKPE